MTSNTTIFTDIDFDKPGKQVGFLNLPHSPHRRRVGRRPDPGLRHQERAGADRPPRRRQPRRRIRRADHARPPDPRPRPGRDPGPPDHHSGDQPAGGGGRQPGLAGRRQELQPHLSGSPIGTVTEQISHYVNDVLFPAGGRLHRPAFGRLVAVAHAQRHHRAGARSRPHEAQHRGGARLRRADDRRDRQSRRSAHLDGVGRARRPDVGRDRDGRRRHRSRRRRCRSASAACATCWRISACCRRRSRDRRPRRRGSCRFPGGKGYVYATADGVFEPFHANGAEVREGEPAGQIHFLTNPGSCAGVAALPHRRHRLWPAAAGAGQAGQLLPGRRDAIHGAAWMIALDDVRAAARASPATCAARRHGGERAAAADVAGARVAEARISPGDRLVQGARRHQQAAGDAAQSISPKGIVTASGGNHGLATARAGRLADVPTTIFLPENVSPPKLAKLKQWGADVRIVGDVWDESNVAALTHSPRRPAPPISIPSPIR